MRTSKELKTKESILMDINLIKKLVKVVEDSAITEFSVQEGDLKIRISKTKGQDTQVFLPQHMNVPMQQPQAFQQPVADNGSQPANDAATAQAAAAGTTSDKQYEVKSPIVGTFYRAPSPDADPYVQVGEKVAPGTLLCIIEAMKLMNEIECDVNGKIVKILVENGQPVEYNQPLFIVEKD